MKDASAGQTSPLPALAAQAAFDEYAGDYEQALNKGVYLSGESPDHFAEKRVAYTALWLRKLLVFAPRRLADFGCGVGNSTPHFRRHFPEAELLGLDVSAASIERAKQIYGDASKFLLIDEARGGGECDLVYSNGVFHHIVPEDRSEWMRRIREILVPGGYVALWENNPLNPGTRMVMRRIPFDRDAIPLAATETRTLLAKSGFQIIGTRFRFYFPKVLSALRGLERFAERVPLGAQYCVLARKPENPHTIGGR
jgi:SAM-dependent methyltransferase